jgi:hypothetical protein
MSNYADHGASKREAIRKYTETILKTGQGPKTIRGIADALRLDEGTVRRHLRDLGLRDKLATLIPEPTVHELAAAEGRKREDAGLRSLYRQALDEVAALQVQLKGQLRAKEFARLITPAAFVVEKSARGNGATAFSLWSDWHTDETVDADAVNGVNEYNAAVAERRLNKLAPAVLNLLNMCRSKSKIDTLVLEVLGDLITGWIHQDLIEDARWTPPEATLLAIKYLSSGIDFLCDHGDLKEIVIVESCGNHSRITQKNPIKHAPQKSYEWLVYQVVAMLQATRKPGKTRVTFRPPAGYFNWIKVYGQDIRSHHGDAIHYQGGTGGIMVPMYRAIADWNTAKHADLDVFGHHHVRQCPLGAVCNGSVIGYSELAVRWHCKHQRPQQSFFIMHERWGRTAEFPVVLE